MRERHVAVLRCWTLLFLVFASSAVFASAAQAVVTVDTTSDPGGPGECSLRNAIVAANTQAVAAGCAAGDPAGSTTTILVPAGHYVLASELDIGATANVAIQGASTADPSQTVI